MAPVEIRVPAMGESITEGVLARWLVAEGAIVEKGAALYEFETDKTNTEVAAPSGGRVVRSVPEGSTVTINTVVGTIDPSVAAAPASSATAPPAAAPMSAPPKQAVAAPAPAPSATGADHSAVAARVSPVAARMLAEANVSASAVPHPGEGRIMARHVAAFLAGATRVVPDVSADAPSGGAVGSGAGSGTRTVRREPISPLRRRLMERIVRDKHTAAMLTTFNEIYLSRFQELSAEFGEPYRKRYGVAPTIEALVIKAAAMAARDFPRSNAMIEGEEVVEFDYVDANVTVPGPAGTAMPVIRDVQRLALPEVEQALASARTRALEGKLGVEELTGGTLTLSTEGMGGAVFGTPALNVPQTCTIGLYEPKRRVAGAAGAVVVRPSMHVALSYDHRLIDGRDAVLFLARVKELVERPERMILLV